MTLLTLFTAPKPMTNPHIALIQRNAFASWKALGDQVRVAIIGDEEGLENTAAEFGFDYLPQVGRNALGTPLISSIFSLGRSVNQSPYLAYVNADIILFPEILDTLKLVGSQMDKFLMVGQRYDLKVTDPLNLDGDWVPSTKEWMRTGGKLHARAGSDYFVYPRCCFDQIPMFSVGRAGWDNWMIYRARRMNWPVVDATGAVDIIHQNHDYSHLPGGQPHYKLPETGVNVKLAGGRRTIFDLNDATHGIVDGRVSEMPKVGKRFWREVEVYPLLKWKSYALTQALFTFFHPVKAWKERKNEKKMREALRKDTR